MWLIIAEGFLALLLAVGFVAWVFSGSRKSRSGDKKEKADPPLNSQDSKDKPD